MWVEVGYDLEQFITDGYAGETSRLYMVPEFRRGQYGAGLLAGVSRIASRIAEGRNVVLQGVPRETRDETPEATAGGAAAHPVHPLHRVQRIRRSAHAGVAVRPLLGRTDRLEQRCRPVRRRIRWRWRTRWRLRRRLWRLRRWPQRRRRWRSDGGSGLGQGTSHKAQGTR